MELVSKFQCSETSSKCRRHRPSSSVRTPSFLQEQKGKSSPEAPAGVVLVSVPGWDVVDVHVHRVSAWDSFSVSRQERGGMWEVAAGNCI